MPNYLFQRYGNMGVQYNKQNNLLQQFAQLKSNPGGILDILLQSGKINQQQYTELQPYKNNPEAIGRYLINSGNAGEISQAERMANSIR